MKKALAIDVGGTKIYNTIINENGEIITEIEKHSTPKTFAEIKYLFEEIDFLIYIFFIEFELDFKGRDSLIFL